MSLTGQLYKLCEGNNKNYNVEYSNNKGGNKKHHHANVNFPSAVELTLNVPKDLNINLHVYIHKEDN